MAHRSPARAALKFCDRSPASGKSPEASTVPSNAFVDDAFGAASSVRRLEIPQIGHRLILLGRHQVAVRTHEVILIAEIDVPVVGAFILEPHALRVAAINPCARPRAQERVVDGGDVVVQQIRIRLIG
jgi:hypothetical protein